MKKRLSESGGDEPDARGEFLDAMKRLPKPPRKRLN